MRLRIVVAAVLVCGAGLAGCTANHDLPTISGAPSSVGDTALEVAAKTYYDCMSNAGIEVELTQNDQGLLSVVQFTGDHEVMWSAPDSGGFLLAPEDQQALRPDTEKALTEFKSTAGSAPTLWIDRVDHSPTYAQCLAESGYSDDAAWGSSTTTNTQALQLQVNANNQWAACARENGWPDIQDSSMPDPQTTTSTPSVLLPGTITEDQLRALLDACPNGNPNSQISDDWYSSHPLDGYPDGYLPNPNIAFSTATGSDGSPGGQVDANHLQRLISILNEKLVESAER